jgi:hypothetical protein
MKWWARGFWTHKLWLISRKTARMEADYRVAYRPGGKCVQRGF